MENEFSKRLISSILLIPLVFFIIVKGGFLFIAFLSICFVISCFEWHLMTKKKSYNIFGYFFNFFFLTVYLIRITLRIKVYHFY